MDKRLLISIVLLCALPSLALASNQTLNHTAVQTNHTVNQTLTHAVNHTSNNTVNQTSASSDQGGFGEFSGNLVYILQSGASHTEYWTLVNKFNYPVSFSIVPPAFNSTPTPPNLTFSVMNGTIPAGSNLTISVVATSPSWVSYIFASKNNTWSGYATAYAKSASTASSGASIALGTAKLITITVEPPNVLPTIIAVIVIVVVIIVGAYLLYSRSRKKVSRRR